MTLDQLDKLLDRAELINLLFIIAFVLVFVVFRKAIKR